MLPLSELPAVAKGCTGGWMLGFDNELLLPLPILIGDWVPSERLVGMSKGM